MVNDATVWRDLNFERTLKIRPLHSLRGKKKRWRDDCG
jgi:hypothetical protein